MSVHPWKESASYKKIKADLDVNLIKINKIDSVSFISKFLVTNQNYCDFLCSLPFSNEIGSQYYFLNTHLYDSRVKRSGEKYFSSLENLDAANPKSVTTDSPYYVTPGYENHPVTCVNWQGAKLFAQLFECDIPSYEQWLLAARGIHSEEVQYSWGNDRPNEKLANYAEHIGTTTVVGSYPPNSIGIYDMLGNVREWLSDDSGIESRLIVGGGWNKSADDLQLKSVQSTWALHSGASIGFRLIKQ